MITREDFEKSLEIARRTQDREAQYKVGKYYLENKDNYSAKDWLTKSADQGHAGAQFEIAKLSLSKEIYYIYHSDYIESAKWCLKAGEQKHSEARVMLKAESKLYQKLADMAKAERLYSSEQAQAAYFLARIHRYDHFEMKDIPKSLTYYEKAAKCSHAEAANELGDLYYYGREVKEDLGKTFAIFKEICDSSSANGYSYYSLGFLYHNGYGTKVNLDEAVRCYDRALREGQSNAALGLGDIYREKYRIKKAEGKDDWECRNFKEHAISYYKKAGNNKNALNELGLLYKEANQFLEAEASFLKAFEFGLAEAGYELASLYEQGKCGADKSHTAIAWYQKAAEKGSSNAQLVLAHKYERGESGLPKDLLKGFSLVKQAEEKGNKKAIQRIQDSKDSFYHCEALYKALDKDMKRIEPYLVLESTLDYTFTNVNHLFNALNRETVSAMKEAAFERYEFLGDRALNFIITKYLENYAPREWNMKQRHDALKDMVSNLTCLSRIGSDLKLPSLIKKGDSEKEHEVTPKMVADATEALIGAIVKDGGYEAAEKVVIRLWEPDLKKRLAASQKDQKAEILPVPQLEAKKILPRVSSLIIVQPESKVKFDKNDPLTPRSNKLFGALNKEAKIKTFEKRLNNAAHAVNSCNVGRTGDTPLMVMLRRNIGSKTRLHEDEIFRIDKLLKAGALWAAPNRKKETAENLLTRLSPEIQQQIKQRFNK